MYEKLAITPPFFEIGPKAFLYGREALRLAQHADKLSRKHGVQIIFTPQYVDIPLIGAETESVLVFAQHMDAIRVGRGIGSVLPEAIKAAGAAGVLLNHAEKPLSMQTIAETIARADEVGLATLVCAGTLEEATRVAHMEPNIVLYESPALIGVGRRGDNDQAVIAQANEMIWAIDPKIRVLHGAGISNGQDVYNIILAGAQGTGSTSGILRAPDPFQMLEEMISNVRMAWDKRTSDTLT